MSSAEDDGLLSAFTLTQKLLWKSSKHDRLMHISTETFLWGLKSLVFLMFFPSAVDGLKL